MPNRETRHDRKKRRQELIEPAMRDREVGAAEPEHPAPKGAGTPRQTGSNVPGRNDAITNRKGRLPE